MADRVQFIMDRMAGMFKELESLQLFTSDEIKSVIKKRTDHEYVLCRRQLTPQDFYDYLQYEIRLEELRALRCYKISKEGKKKELQNKFRSLHANFMRHLCYIFDRGVRRFPHELTMWEDYLSFLKSIKAYSIRNTVLGKALSLHPTVESFWVQAAMFELDVQNNSHAARVLLQRSLRLNKKSTVLWLRYFEFEVWNVVKLQERSDILTIGASGEQTSRVVSPAAPLVVYRHALAAVPEITLAISLHESCLDGIHAGIADAIAVDMESQFGNLLEYWKYALKSHLRQFRLLLLPVSVPAVAAASASAEGEEEAGGKRKRGEQAEVILPTEISDRDSKALLKEAALVCSAAIDRTVSILHQAQLHTTPEELMLLKSEFLEETLNIAKLKLFDIINHKDETSASTDVSLSKVEVRSFRPSLEGLVTCLRSSHETRDAA